VLKDWQLRGKESSPEMTVEKIKRILKEYEFETSMQDMEQDLKDCYSCRLTINGPTAGYMGTNGKGMTKALSYASAYGEMMERVENRIFLATPRYDDEKYEDFLLNDAPLYDVRDAEQEECILQLKKKIASTVKNVPIFTTADEVVNTLFEKIAPIKLNGKFGTMPYFSIRKQKWVYLPDWLCIFTGSNGCAAGNTPAEAMVEGISELLERYSQMEILDCEIIPPQIPKEYIARYPHIYKIIDEIESNGRYKVRVLDCSLGKGLPVVCGMIIDTFTGKFGVKFGAQPNMAVALERVFTESMQGNHLESFSNASNPFYTLPDGSFRNDKWNSMKIAASSMPATLLMDDPSYEFVPWGEDVGHDNVKLMWDMIEKMEELGADIYVRDASYLGFPCVNIYATGITECIPIDQLELKIHLLGNHVQQYFRRIDTLTDEEVSDLATFASIKRGAVLENKIDGISHLYFKDEMPGTPFEADFLLAACQYRLGNIEATLKVLSEILRHGSYLSKRQLRFVRGSYFYIQGLFTGRSEKNAYDVVSNLCGDVAEEVRESFMDRQLVLGKLYPVCHNKPCNEIDEAGSPYKAIHDFFKVLVKAENDHPADRKVFEELFKR